MDLPSHYIQRTFGHIFSGPPSQLALFPVWLLLGPRQVGKSTLLSHAGPERLRIDLDDLSVRSRAQQDPALFVRNLKPPLIIDEIQYAPALLSGVKQLADRSSEPGAIWLTGSQNFQVMHGITETLAGRVALLNLFGLSDEEKALGALSLTEYFARIVETSFPKLYGVNDTQARALYLSSYAQTYIERDIRELMRIERRREFEVFVRMCALRTAQIINLDSLAREVGVSASTIKAWLSLLEDSFLIRLVQPYHRHHSKRLIKSPKLYFIDMGLAAYLAGWPTQETLQHGPMAGAAFETHVFGQILRFFRHRAREVQIYFWRTRDGQEIDFLVEYEGRCVPIEVKLGSVNTRELVQLETIRDRSWQNGYVISLTGTDKPTPLNADWQLLAPWGLHFD